MICTVGLTCLDIVSFVPKFPVEDSDQRCTKQSWERGGNASNNATVLACLGQSVEYFGTLANDHLLNFFKTDFNSYGIKCDSCPIVDGIGKAPSSVVICSEETGSRTIVHCNGGLRELTLEDFSSLDLSSYSWIHFEGRNESVVKDMIHAIHEFNTSHLITTSESDDDSIPAYRKVKLPVSIEVEKRRDTLSDLLPLAHVVFVGKDFAELLGAENCLEAPGIIAGKVEKGTLIICPWGDQGASFCVTTGDNNTTKTHKIDAVRPSKIIDSLGAGDTFIASTISSLNQGLDISRSVKTGCTIASKKLEVYGFRGISNNAPSS